ncbi:DUF3558 domain-containing protein [Lentzea sp. NPDC004782]|uniref:DUF3558 domain-containing protein n=1 Tax=Lentzea sp. NPDC004782 TaxID=3154458 RepID=UPI0033B62D92
MKSTLLIALTIVTLAGIMSACSGTEPGRPTASNPTGTTPSSTSKAAPGPDLDLSKFTSRPCDLLTAAQLAQLGTFDPPTSGHQELGPGCRWEAKEVLKGAAYSVTLSTEGNTLESMREASKAEPVFRETTVAGYPAFSKDGTTGKGNCGTAVKTSSKEAIYVQISTLNKETPEYKDSCRATEKVAALVVQNLKG